MNKQNSIAQIPQHMAVISKQHLKISGGQGIYQEKFHPSPLKLILKMNKMDPKLILQNIWLNTSHKVWGR